MCNRLIPMSSRACVVGICSRLASRRGSRCRPGRCLVPRRSGLPEAGPPKRGGILRVRGYDPVHFDHHLTTNFKTNTTLSFVYSRLVRHKVGAGVQPGTLIVEPDLAERWETPDDTTYVFYLRKGFRWHHKPPLNGRELVAEDVKFTFDRRIVAIYHGDLSVAEPTDVGRADVRLASSSRGRLGKYAFIRRQMRAQLRGRKRGDSRRAAA
jgi:hypothetical protein